METPKKEELVKFIVSRIRSFEKNPLRLGIPRRFKREMYIIMAEAGV
jgi:hypothetical protein